MKKQNESSLIHLYLKEWRTDTKKRYWCQL